MMSTLRQWRKSLSRWSRQRSQRYFNAKFPDPRTLPKIPVPEDRDLGRITLPEFACLPITPPDYEANTSEELLTLVSHQRKSAREAAVAIILAYLPDQPNTLGILLTRRSATLKEHAGQISFPGGSKDPEDIDALATAQRETVEEIGIDPRTLRLLGYLPYYFTRSGFKIRPVVFFLEDNLNNVNFSIDSGEVSEVFIVPLSVLLNPRRHERREIKFFNQKGYFYAMPAKPEEVVSLSGDTHGGDYFVWGATGGMIRLLYETLI